MSITSTPPLSTCVTIDRAPFLLSYASRVLLLGSCFSTSIGKRLLKDQFQIQLSPFGIVYDVSAMADQLELLMSDQVFNPDDLIFDGELYHSLTHHGNYSGTNAQGVADLLNQELGTARAFLQRADWLLLTWATTRTFTHLETGRRVE